MHIDENGFELDELHSVDGAAFWVWDSSGEALNWVDGRTVVFREELILILENLPGPELPLPGALMLVLAACRGLLPDSRELQARLPKDEAELPRDQIVAMAKTYRAGAEQLEKLAQLPEHLRRSPVAKANLIALLPQNPPRPRAASKALLLQLLRGPRLIDPFEKRSYCEGNFPWVREFAELRETFAGLSPEAIERAASTGLTELPKAAEVEIPLGERVRRLLDDLAEEPEFSALAALTREVMAALLLPRALPRLDYETPGGFSDIGNRGPLHRLLISELAYDDDTLAARIALNEALYLRREPSALPPPSTLAVILDAGVRMWGIPRVLATAVGLAVLAKGEQYAGSVTFRATAGGLAPVSLDTREGLTAQLEALETAINPAAAFPALERMELGHAGKLEILLITHPRCLEDAELLAALDKFAPSACHAATVDREGNFTLALRTANHWSPLAAARLNVETLFTQKNTIRRATAGTLPAFYFEGASPLLLPLSVQLRTVIRHAAESLVGFGHDGGLWVWKGRDQGARRLPFEPLPGAFWGLVFARFAGATVAITYEASRHQLLIAVWTGPDMKRDEFVHQQVHAFPNPPLRAWVDGDVLFVGTRAEVFALTLAGEIHARAALPPGASWAGRRFLGRQTQGRHEFFNVMFNGQSVVFAQLSHRFLYTPTPALLLCDPSGNGNIIAFHRNGQFVDALSGEVVLTVPAKCASFFEGLSDGCRVIFQVSPTEELVADLRTRLAAPGFGDAERRGDSHPVPRRWSVRSKFSHVALSGAGRVCLRAQKGYWVEIRFHPEQSRLSLHRLDELEAGILGVLTLSGREKIPAHGTCLQTADWPTGSRIALDERGLLHLQSVDPSIPEISIVLAESISLPAWSSDGLKIGPGFFTGQTVNSPEQAAQIDASIQRFVASCR